MSARPLTLLEAATIGARVWGEPERIGDRLAYALHVRRSLADPAYPYVSAEEASRIHDEAARMLEETGA